MRSFIQTALVLILALGSISAFACQGSIQERGSNRKIVRCQEGEKAQLKLLEGNKEIKKHHRGLWRRDLLSGLNS